ncbi:MAG: Ribonuclease [Candidatus Parcubacteria bacterium]|jgi:ribonuclease P protein component
MLPKKHRLSRRDIAQVEKQGQRLRFPAFVCLFRGCDAFGVGISVSKKVAKDSVARNRIRRRIYKFFQGGFDLMPAHILIIPMSPIATLSEEELSHALQMAVTRLTDELNRV